MQGLRRRPGALASRSCPPPQGARGSPRRMLRTSGPDARRSWVGSPRGVEDVASDALRGQTAMVDLRDCVGGDVDAVHLVQCLGKGAAVERVVFEEERAVEVEER